METSCGVVLVNFGSILLLQYPQGHWDFPKGHIEESDEDKKATAARELSEETGISEIEFIDDFEYRTAYEFRHKGRLIEKQVFWFIAETETMSVNISHEHTEHLWLEWDDAMKQLTHHESQGVLAAAHTHLKSINRA
ncbi:MAG: NUDIX domain-containing protein [Candidatus Poseidoniaceae archaeon]|nr:NUDIX domain-containing protein [Candidatus Poseidoniaceae archaeon]